MDYVNLGRTGLEVSRICLGCLTFGGQADEKESLRIVDTAWDAGINFFDTANVYTETLSETYLGKALKGRRDRAVIATKVRGRIGPGVNDAGLSRKHIMDAVDASLMRLQTDYIDLYQVHSWDADAPLEETLRALDDLVRLGKVRYIGCSNFAGWQLTKSLWISDLKGLARFETVQPRYNLLFRGIEEELLPVCLSQGVGVIPYNPIAAGLLTGKHKRGQPPVSGTRFDLREVYRDIYWYERNFEAVEKLEAIAGKYGHTLIQLALSWVLANPAITSAIVGASSAEQLQQSISAAEARLEPEEIAACDPVWNELKGAM